MKTSTCTLVIAFVLSFSGIASAELYDIDPGHSSVTFKVRHLFSSVTGRFEKFEGKVGYDEKDPKKSHVEGSIEAASINTNVAKRDDHLRGADFFDVAKYPKITFEKTEVIEVSSDGKTGKMRGNLTMHGVTKPVVLDVAMLGKGKDPQGKERIGLQATTKVNRKDFGLAWNKALEGGGMLVGEDVTIEIDAEAVRAD